MRATLGRDVQHRFGRHVYRGRAFGLSRAGIDEAFAGYRARFGIRHEKGEREEGPAHPEPGRAAWATGAWWRPWPPP